MYIEQKVQLLAEEIEDIADKQNDVYKALKDKDVKMQESFDKLNQERRRYDDVLDEFNKIAEKNSELNSPVRFNNVDSLFLDINKSYEKAVDNLKSGYKNKSVKSVKSTNESLNNLANSLRNSLQENSVSMNIENVDNLKSILKNLVYFSFAQEDILLKMDKIFNNNSEVSDILKAQNVLLDIKYSFTDSLYSIADRTPQISSKVYTELLSLEYELKKSIEFIENGNYGGAKVSQQFSVKSVNTIALFIDEVIDQINKLLENAKPGGNGKGNGKSQQISMLKSSQEALKKQLEDMIKKMESGKGLSNEQLGKTLMQQEMIRSLMNDIIMEGGISNKAVENLKLAESLIEQNIKDFVYNNTSRTTLLRQNSIFKYLLDAENAEMKRGFDKERESVTAKKINRGDAIEFFEDNSELNERGNEQLEILPIRVNSFYKKKYKLYKMLVDE
jgi:ribosomal protein L17